MVGSLSESIEFVEDAVALEGVTGQQGKPDGVKEREADDRTRGVLREGEGELFR